MRYRDLIPALFLVGGVGCKIPSVPSGTYSVTIENKSAKVTIRDSFCYLETNGLDITDNFCDGKVDQVKVSEADVYLNPAEEQEERLNSLLKLAYAKVELQKEEINRTNFSLLEERLKSSK